MMWILKDHITGNTLYGPDRMPQDWGPICGVKEFLETHGSMAAVGHPHLEWVRVGDPPIREVDIRSIASDRLKDSERAIAPNARITVKSRIEWLKYRQLLMDMIINPKKYQHGAIPTPPEA